MPYLDITDHGQFVHLLQLYLHDHPEAQAEHDAIRGANGVALEYFLSSSTAHGLATWARDKQLITVQAAARLREVARYLPLKKDPEQDILLTQHPMGTPPRLQPTVPFTALWQWIWLCDIPPETEDFRLNLPAAIHMVEKIYQEQVVPLVRERAQQLLTWLRAKKETRMDDVPTTDATPNFICPTCGAFSSLTWDDAATKEGAHDLTVSTLGIVGQVCIEMANGFPPATICQHPDGSTFTMDSMMRAVMNLRDTHGIAREEAEQRLLAGEGLADADAYAQPMPERPVYRLLGAALYLRWLQERAKPPSARHPVTDRTQAPGLFRRLDALLQRLKTLTPSPRLARFTSVADRNFTALQYETLCQIELYAPSMDEQTLITILTERHVLTPEDIRRAFEK